MTVEYRSGGRSFTISDRDRVVLGRALLGESGDRRAEYSSILWTLARRFLWSRFDGSFIDLVTAFCQPINPRWMPGGDLFEDAKKRGMAAASDNAVTRRLWLASLSWSLLPSAVREAVTRFQFGALPESRITADQRSTNWGSWQGIEQKHPAGVSVAGSKNWFFRDLPVRGLQVLTVPETVGGVGALAVLALVVGGLWWVTR